MQLNNNDRRMLKAMLSDPGRTWNLEQLLSETGALSIRGDKSGL